MTAPTKIENDGTIYTTKELAAWCKCSPAHIRREYHRGKLTGHRLGAQDIRFKGDEAHKWFNALSTNSETTVSDPTEGITSSAGPKEVASGHRGWALPAPNQRP